MLGTSLILGSAAAGFALASGSGLAWALGFAAVLGLLSAGFAAIGWASVSGALTSSCTTGACSWTSTTFWAALACEEVLVVFFFSAPVLVPCFFVFVAIPYSLVPYSMASSTMRLISMRAGQLLMQRPQPMQENAPQFSG